MYTYESFENINLEVANSVLEENNSQLQEVFEKIASQVEFALIKDDQNLRDDVISNIHTYQIGWAFHMDKIQKPNEKVEIDSYIVATCIWEVLLWKRHDLEELYRLTTLPRSMLVPEFVWSRYLLLSLADTKELTKYKQLRCSEDNHIPKMGEK